MLSWVFHHVSKIVIRWYVHLFGVKFYPLNESPKTDKLNTLTVELTKGRYIVFNFYIEPIDISYLRFGRVNSYIEDMYVIYADFIGDKMPNELVYFGDTKLSIYRGLIFKFNQKAWFEVLTEIYLDFIRHRLKKSREV